MPICQTPSLSSQASRALRSGLGRLAAGQELLALRMVVLSRPADGRTSRAASQNPCQPGPCRSESTPSSKAAEYYFNLGIIFSERRAFIASGNIAPLGNFAET
ncbi:hypothetical protein E2C05_07455 [Paracraurococcus ruber]|nr:hypothetical protein E2C05_07455 [Paracraurococcus ruber]